MCSETKKRLIDLYKDAFSEDSDDFVTYFFDHYYDADNVFTRSMNGEIVCVTHVVDKRLNYCGNIVTCPYLVAVSTRSDLRGRRLIESVIGDALDELKCRHMPFVLLYPFKHSYYTKYGFSTIEDRLDFSSVDFSAFEIVKTHDIDRLYDIFTRRERELDISIHRDIEAMNARLEMFYVDSEDSFVLRRDGEDVGYLLKYGDEIDECIMLENSLSNIENPNIAEGVMARLVDIPVALELMHFGEDVEYHATLHVIDEFMGDSYVRISIDAGEVSAHYTDSMDNSIPTIDISIQSLTQFVFGRNNMLGSIISQHLRLDIVDKY